MTAPTPAEPQPFTAEEALAFVESVLSRAEMPWNYLRSDFAKGIPRLAATLSSLLEDQKRMEHTDRVKVVLGFAEEEARSMGAAYVTTAHLLLGILREGQGVAMAVLTNLSDSLSEDWITLDSAREMTARLFGLSTGAARSPVQHQKG